MVKRMARCAKPHADRASRLYPLLIHRTDLPGQPRRSQPEDALQNMNNDSDVLELLWDVVREARLGKHDTPDGQRPVIAFIDSGGDIAVVFEGGACGRWSRKVRHLGLGFSVIGYEVRV